MHRVRSALLLTLLCIVACADRPSSGAPGSTGTGAALGQVVAEVIRVVGQGGLVAAGAPAGSFLGAGAQLTAGQQLSLPAGTVALVKLGAAQLSLNEDTALTLGKTVSELTLDRGEVLVTVPRGASDVIVHAGQDVLHVGTGEARILRIGDEGDYSALDGSTRVVSDGKEVTLDAGMSVRTPVSDAAVSGKAPIALPSVHVAEGANWAAILQQVQRHATLVPRGVGSLKAREAGSKFEMQALKLADQKVQVTVAGRVAHTRVEQTFENSSSKVLEGIYRFALPPDASISDLELLVGKRWMRAEMLEKKRATRIFRAIVDATIPRDPALLQWEQGSVFKMNIFPIPAGGARSIRIGYTQVLKAHGDTLRYRYPMDGSGSGASGNAIGSFSFDALIAGGDGEGLRTSGLDAERTREGSGVRLRQSARDYLPTRDLGIDVPVPADQRRIHQQAMLAKDGKAYFMLSLTPELPASERPLGGVDYAFVLDRSHSTTPALWALAGTVVQTMVDRLGEGDRFEVLACDTACDAMSGPQGTLRAADDKAAASIKRFVEGQDLAGASDIGGMVQQAAAVLAAAQRPDAEQVVVYVGDGVASAGELRPDELARDVAASLDGQRLEALALGARADVLALRALTEAGRGDVMRIDVSDDPVALAGQLALRARYRAHAGLSLSLPSAAYDVHPATLPPLRPGDRITVVGKLRGPLQGEARLSGEGVDEAFALSLSAEAPDPKSPRMHLPRTWAREQIDVWTRTRGDGARKEIIKLSKQHTVMSRYTALIALENDAMYREFGVKREAKNSEGWKGQLDESDAQLATGKKDASYQARSQLGDEEEAPAPSADELDEDELAGPAESARPPEPVRSAPRKRARAKARRAPPQRSMGGSSDMMLDNAYGDAPSPPPAPAAERSRPNTGSQRFAGRGSAPKPKKMAPPSDLGALDGLGSGSAGGGSKGSSGRRPRRPHALPPTPPRPRPRPRPRRRHRVHVVSSAKPASDRTRDRIAAYATARDATPDNRAAHRKLVRSAIVADHESAGAYAAAWVEADPDHSRALRALADTLASAGDRRAMRAYASAAEVRPFSPRYQKALAAAYERSADHRRACAHRRSLVSIAPRNGEAHARLARCLHDAGRRDEAQRVLDAATGLKRGRDAVEKLRSQLAQGAVPQRERAYLHPGAALKVTLTWDDPNEQLDIGLIDSRGRRLSSLWSDSLAVREEPGKQTVTLARLTGSVRIEVTRRGVANADRYGEGGGQQPAPGKIKASVRVDARTQRTFPIELSGGSLRVARVAPAWR